MSPLCFLSLRAANLEHTRPHASFPCNAAPLPLLSPSLTSQGLTTSRLSAELQCMQNRQAWLSCEHVAGWEPPGGAGAMERPLLC